MSASKLFRSIAFVGVAVLAVLGIANVFGYSPFPLSQSDRSQTVLLKSVKDVSQFHGAVGTFEENTRAMLTGLFGSLGFQVAFQ